MTPEWVAGWFLSLSLSLQLIIVLVLVDLISSFKLVFDPQEI